jgi:hypothetical protein
MIISASARCSIQTLRQNLATIGNEKYRVRYCGSGAPIFCACSPPRPKTQGQMEFIVYIDESGDEGLDCTAGKSKRWFFLCAVIYPAKSENQILSMFDAVRLKMGKPDRFYFHFTKLKHDQRVALIHAIAQLDMRVICVRFDKPKLYESADWKQREKVYWYATKLLLERVSWECSDIVRKTKQAQKRAAVCFSNRGNLEYENLRDYLRKLKTDSDAGKRNCNISWNCISPERIYTIPATQRVGLQVADAVCGAFHYAHSPNTLGFTEPRYLGILEAHGRVAHDKAWPE